MFWNKNDKPALSPQPTMIRTSLAISLEPRMLFDGAVAATVAEAATAETSSTPNADSSFDSQAVAPTSATSDQRQEVVFIDSSVKDNQQLLDSLAPGTEVVVLDSTQDGLTQMAQYLDGRSGIDAIHLISHGGEANLLIGSARLNLDNIADAQSQLAAIGSSLTESGDFLIYGCDTSKGEQGTAFITQLANFTGADIAASDDWTGDTNKGGNWVLESSTGAIEAATLFADASYNHVLNTLNAGDIVVLGWSAVSDTITFATLVDIPAGTVIKITDWGWNAAGNAFTGGMTGDGLITWTTGSTIEAGTILNLFLGGTGDSQPTTLTNVTTNTDLSANIVVSGYSVSDPMNVAGDGVFIYQDSDANPYFIFGFNNSSGTNTDANNWNTATSFITLRDSTLPGGSGSQNALTNGVNAIGLPSGANQQDNVQYTGPTSAADRATWLARITNLANWSGDNDGSTTTSVGVSGGSEVNILPPNAAPVINNLNGDSTTFTEGGSAVLLDVGSNATVTDADSADFGGGNVTVAITAGGTTTEDVLAIRNEGTGTGQISVSGSTVSYGGTAIGTITSSGTGGASLVVTLNANANAAAVQALIHNLTYANSNDADPSTAARTVSITVNDGDGGTSTAAAVTVNVTGVNDAPTLTATGGTPTYTENGSAVDLFSSVTISTVEAGQTITGLGLTVSNLADGSHEILTIDGTDIALTDGTTGTTIGGNAVVYSVSVTGGTATITLTSAGLSPANAQSLVDGISYRNSSESPDTTSRVITLTAITDSGGTANGGVDTSGLSIAATVAITAVNDAPTLSGGPYSLTGTDEDTVSNSTLVSTILAGLTHADADAGAVSGIAITASSGNGTWQYSTDGLSWNSVGNVSGGAALLLSGDTQLRYVPDGMDGETATLTFRAWDQTSGVASTNMMRGTADTSINGGTTAFSSDTAAASLAVTAINDAPTLSGGPYSLTGTDEDTVSNSTLVSTILAGLSHADVDAGAVSGIAITASSGNGTWQYSTDGLTWNGVGSVSGGAALLLSGDTQLRYVPDGIDGETATLTFRAWDQTSGTASTNAVRNTADTSSNGGTTAFSTATATASLVVAAINDAPIVGNLDGDSRTYTQGAGAIPLDTGANASVSDIDSANFDGGNLTVSIVANGVAGEDLLGINHQGTGPGQIGVSGTDVTYGGVVIGTLSGGSEGNDLLVSFNGNATAAAAQALIRNLTYDNDNASNDIGQTDRTIRVTLDDGDGGTSSNADITVSVVETVPPTATIMLSDTALTVGETSTVTITFSEAVSGLTVDDFTVANGDLSGLTSSDNITWTATFTPTANIEDSSNLITLDNSGVTDAAGNTGIGTTDSANYAIDTLRPSATIVVGDTALTAGETTTVTITFNEAVIGLTTGDFAVANGSLSGLTTSDNITWTATLTPTVNIEDTTNLITLDNTGYTDAAGNTGTGTTDSNNYAIDTLRPSASIVVADAVLTVGETTTVTITFNEAVTGLALSDFTVANGTLSELSSADGGITWTATLTPATATENAGNLITLDNTGYTDAAGNTGTGSTDSNSYLVDTLAPLNDLPGNQTTNTIGSITFSSGNGNALSVSSSGTLTTIVSVTGGVLTATTGGGATISNNGTASVTLEGSEAQINAALEGLVFTPGNAGNITLNLQTTDAAGNVDSDDLGIIVDNSTLVVTSNLDTGSDASTGSSYAEDLADGNGLSLREALAWARSGDTITFDLDPLTAGNQGGTIVLGGSHLTLTTRVTINGDLNNDGAADVTISGNNASRVMVINNNVSGVELTGLTLTQGTVSGGGGGLYLGTGTNTTIRDSNITNNTETSLGGGGVYGNAATLTMINTTVSGNSSVSFGGGLRIVGGGGTLNLINSTVTDNVTTGTGAHGGGIQFGGSVLTVVNSTISGNAATGATSLGGGLRITSGTSYVYNSTIVGNAAAGSGGGVHANGNDTFVNTVVAGNTSGAGATAAVGGSPLATGGIADDVGSTIEMATNNYFGSNVIITDNDNSLNNQGTANLLLGNLAYHNGNHHLTHRPLAGSALVDAGSNAAVPADTYDLDGDGNISEQLPLDANGNERISNIVDIGAVEGNTMPVIGGLNGGGTFVENGSAIVIDDDATLSDVEMDALNGGNGNYASATLVIARSGGAVASDSFGFLDGNGITLSGNQLLKNGQAIATVDDSTAGQWIITFTDANGEIPTRADATAILQQLTYRSTSDDPGSSLSLEIRFTDDMGGFRTGEADVSITEINDAPTLTATGGTPTFIENGAAVDLFSGVTISTVEAGQSITGLALTVSGLADGSSEILSIDGSDIVLIDGSSGTTAGNSLSYSVSVVGGTASITLGSTGLSSGAAQTLVEGINYRNASEAPSGSARVITLTAISDNGGTANGGTDSTALAIAATVSISAVNDAPTITAPGSIAVTEDVPGALTGISFADVDAGSSNVTVTFSVPSGTLSAISGSGVTVGGTASALTLTGSIANINAFIAAAGVSFTTASNATNNVTLSVTIDDGGNTGSGGAQTDTTSVTLTVTAVNDAPVNSVPADQSVDQDANLVFNSGNGNLISISDVDAGSNTVEVTLSASNGLLSLSGITGLSFSSGDGTGDASMTFSGSIAAINNALDGLVFTPTAGYNGPVSLTITTNDQGWSGSGGAQSDTDTIVINIEPINPEIIGVGAAAADGAYKIGDVIDLTITFDQVVLVDTSGGTPSLLLETGAIDRSAIYLAGSGSNTLTFRYTVQAGDVSADLDYQSSTALSLNGATIRSGAGNDAVLTLELPGTAGSLGANTALVIDGVRPTASIMVGDTALSIGETTTVTITFSEAVSGLTVSDFAVANGALSGLSSSDGGITWTATLTPDANIEDTSNLIALDNTGYTDAAGNTGTGTTDSNNYAIDTLRPTASIVVNDTALAAGETTTVTITFSEAVTGLTVSDFAVANGALSDLSSSDGGITWTATLMPDANIEDTSNLITLDNAGVQDAAGNSGTGTTDSNNYAIDTQRPVASSIVVSDTQLVAGETTTVTITFSEAVTGLTVSDFTVANGTLSELASIDGGVTWTATLTPDASIEDTSNLITLDGTQVTDLAGNAGSGTIDSNNYTIDTLRPTASIVVNDTALAVGETTTVTIIFSEAVTGLDLADFSVANGSLSDLSSSDGGITWTATLTPGANVENAANLITLNNAGYTDAAGNTGSGTTDSNNYTVDTQRPTASIVVSDTELSAGETTTVTITFSEAVTGLDLADFSVANGSLSELSSSDGGITWTATLTPSANVENAANLITLNNAGYTDAAGNTGIGTTDSNNYTVDTQRPTATIVVSDTELSAGETTAVTITFSEAVTGLDLADFSVANGSLSGLSSSDGGITWTATLTPGANVENTANLITLNNSGVQDAAGNTGTGTTSSNSYVIDTQVPTVSSVSVPPGMHYSAGGTLTFVVNASEVVWVDGTPRLALDIGGTTVFADYVSGSGSGALVFEYNIAAGLNDADGIEFVGVELNGGALRDAIGNPMDLTLNNVGDTSEVIVDTTAPQVSAITATDPSPSNAGSLHYTVTFSEDVSGVDLSDFSLITTGNVVGTLGSLTALDGRTYRVTIDNVAGSGTLALALADSGTAIADAAGNSLISGLIGESYAVLDSSAGDPEYRAYSPSHGVPTPDGALPPVLPVEPPSPTASPLLPPPLFEVPTLGSGLPTLGSIFIAQNSLAPSFIAQVFSSSGAGFGDGRGAGFLGFGGGDGGVFGSSSLSSIFDRELLPDEEELEIFDREKAGVGFLGAPTLGQQLNDLHESEHSQLRDLAAALQQIAATQSRS